MSELVSEPITPLVGTFDAAAMGRGEPGLPGTFTWRDRAYQVASVLGTWKESGREGGTGELYLRRHCFKLVMNDNSTWSVYFVRQTPKSGNPQLRWFLYAIE